MAETGHAAGSSDEARIEELLRVNAELATEIRNLQAGRASEPRSGAMPAARRLGRLNEELEEVRTQELTPLARGLGRLLDRLVDLPDRAVDLSVPGHCVLSVSSSTAGPVACGGPHAMRPMK